MYHAREMLYTLVPMLLYDKKGYVNQTDLCFKRLLMLLQGPFAKPSFGQIREIIVPIMASPRDANVRIVVQLFDLNSSKHVLLDMPMLSRSERNAVLLPEV